MEIKNLPQCLARRLWQYSRSLFFLLGLALLLPQQAEASHLSGADISYQCVGQNRYVVTLRLYRDCNGINLGTSESITFGSASCNIPATSFTLPRDTFYEVSQLCPSVLPTSSCNSSAPGALPGYEVYVYSDTIDFPQTCSDWIVSYSTCCRNSSITNIASPGGFYIEGMINSGACNNSPTFSTIPTPYFCAGQTYQYSHGASDPEGDTLLYALTCPLTAAGNCVGYSAGYSMTQPLRTQPINSFGFNQFTGQMSFTPLVGLPQVSVAAITVFNIVNGDTIGYVQRDIQMVVLDGANCTTPIQPTPPIVIGGGLYDTLSGSFVICAGDTLQFQIDMTDPDGDTIQIAPSNTNLDQVFGVGNWSIFRLALNGRQDSVRFYVEIQANPNLIGSNQFTIGVTDGACPIPGDQVLGYNLVIPGVEVIASDTTICPGIAQQIQMTANSFSTVGGNVAGTFSWVQVPGVVAVTFSNDTIPNPIISVPGTTQNGDSIILQVTYTTLPDPVTGTRCVTTDNVVIYLRSLPLSMQIAATDTSICPDYGSDTVSFSTTVTGPGIDLVNGTYSWTASPATFVDSLTNPSVNNPSATFAGGPGDSVVYHVSYTYGTCIGSDSVTIRWRDGVGQAIASLDTICPGDTIQLTAGLTDTITRANPNSCNMYSIAPITFAPLTGASTNSVTLADDQLSSPLPIGFIFEFYCETYNSFSISSNGFITFDLASINGCCTGGNIPNGNQPNAFVALAWEDLNPSAGGTITYFNIGNAPNRKLVVEFNNVPRYGGANNVTGQIVLYEGSNEIEIHTTNVQPDGNTTQGIENSLGTAGVAVPGRNSSVWTATNDAYRFVPQQSLIFVPISYSWTPTFAVSNATIYNPTSIPQTTTNFVVNVIQGGCVLVDSVEVVVRSVIAPPTVTQGTPANQATSVLFNWGMSPGATGWEYSIDSGVTWIARVLADSSLLITGLTNGDCADIMVRATSNAGICPNNAATYLRACTTPCPPPNTTLTTNLNCNGSADGTIRLGVSGGVLGSHPNFMVTLFDTSGTQIGTPVSTLDTARFNGLGINSYYMYIIDTLGCFAYSDTVTITQPNTLVLSLDSTTLTNCLNSADGTASVTVTGGTSSYSYLWNAATGNQTTMTATNLARGTYQVILTDANNCMDTLDVVVQAPFSALPALSLNTTNNTSCNGNATASVMTTTNMVGNANNFTYQWSNTMTGSSITGLGSGTYTITVTDENNCTATNTFTIAGSPSLAITALQPNYPSCGTSNGQITAVATGDATGYSYLWSNGATTALVSNLFAGTYIVTVTGLSNNCTVVDSIRLTNTSGVNIVGFNTNDPTCGGNDGDITVLHTGANAPVTYLWSTGATTASINNLGAGTHTVTITDASNCIDIADTILVRETLNLSTISSNDPVCNLSNGDIIVGVSGISGIVSYNWSNGATTANISGLASGTYTVTATYQSCTASVSTTLSQHTLQVSIFEKDDITCNGDLSSYAYANATNNSSAVNYSWTGPNGFTSTNDSITGLAPGVYTVSVDMGANSCTVTQSLTVVDITLAADAWVHTQGQDHSTIQIGDIVNISGGITTNHFNPTFVWTEQFANVVTLGSMTDSATTATGLGTATNSDNTWLTITATAGPCTVSDSVWIEVQTYLGMPTAFTPNGDGINDLFRPTGLQNYAKVFQFKIWNRFGQLVYDNAANPQWDGTLNGVAQPRDVYIYEFEYAPDNADPILIRGEITLLR